jgi:hypothetical protein
MGIFGRLAAPLVTQIARKHIHFTAASPDRWVFVCASEA